jgi:Prokaryotic Cytochrome C oxidase subunit IV
MRSSTFPRGASIAWMLLMAATLVSFGLGDGLGTAKLATVTILIVAFGKVNLVGNYFMELRGAPLPLRVIFTGWTAVVGTVLVVMYLTQ